MILSGLSLPLVAAFGGGRAFAAQGAAAQPAVAEAFDADTVARLARSLAAQPYRPPNLQLPPELAGLDYDQYRDYRFRADQAGTFPFYCNLQIDAGCRQMRGELVVRPRR